MQVADRAAESTSMVTDCRASYDWAPASSSRIFPEKKKTLTIKSALGNSQDQPHNNERSLPIKGRQRPVTMSCRYEKSVCSPATSTSDTFHSSGAAATAALSLSSADFASAFVAISAT